MREMFINAPVAAVILVANIAISYYALVKNPSLRESWLLHPYRIVREGRWYTILTHGFIHGNFIHLFINMFVFYSFGFYLEMIVGHLNFFLIYFGSLLISGLVSTLKRRDRPDFRSLGASGAISGLILSFVLFNPTATLLLFFILPMPAWFAALLFIFGSYYAAKNNYLPGIDHEGHIWGALAGAGLTVLLEPRSLVFFFGGLFGG